jgi:hypothetical protein
MNFNYWIYLFPIFLLVKASTPADQVNITAKFEQALIDDKYLDDFIFPPEQSCFDPDDDFTQPPIFDVATPITSNNRTTHYAAPIVADVTGDGSPEILVLSSDNIVNTSQGYFSNTTKNIIVYKYDGTTINQIGIIITPQLNFEGLTPFVVGKVNASDPYPTIFVATSQNQAANPRAVDGTYGSGVPDLNNPNSSKIIAYRFTGALGGPDTPGVFAEIGRTSIKYGDNVPSVELTNGTTVQFMEGAAPGMADFDQNGVAELYIYNEIYDLSTLPNITRKAIGPSMCPGGIPCGIGMAGYSHFQTRPDLEANIGLDTQYSLVESNGGTMALTVAADVMGDGRLELLAGNTVYTIDGAWNMTPTMAPPINGQIPRDGLTGVASILGTSPDGNGPNDRLDIIVTNNNSFGADNRQVYVWNPNGSIAYTTVSLNRPDLELPNPFKRPVDNFRLRMTGAPFIGNIQGDRTPEIGFTVTYGLWMLEYDRATNQLRPLNSFGSKGNGMLETTDESGYTKLTMFDFDQDLIQEIVYRDEDFLRILGPNGSDKLAPLVAKSNTAGEGAIVADLDKNGQAEIVYTEDNSQPFGRPEFYSPSRLTVLKSAGTPWAPARSVWNQYGYFNVNVGGDLSIPRQQLNHAGYAQNIFPDFPKDDPASHCVDPYEQPLNNFLVQATFFSAAGCPTSLPVFDIIVVDAFANRVCDPGKLSTVFTIRNGSALVDVPNNTKFSFYFNGNTSPFAVKTLGELVDDPDFVLSFENGELQIIYVLEGLAIPAGDVEIIILGNYSGDISYQADGTAVFNPDYFEFIECNYDNNTTQDPVEVLNTPEFTIDNTDPFYCEGDDLNPNLPTITLTPNEEFTNVIAAEDLADFFEAIGLEIRWEYGLGATPADVSTWIPIGPGVAEFEIGPTGLTLTANGLAPGIYQIRAVRDCNGPTYINTQIEVFDVPENISFTGFNITCNDQNDGSIEPDSGTIPTTFDVWYELYLGGNLIDANDTGLFIDLSDGDYEIKYYNKKAFELDPQLICEGIGGATIVRPTLVEGSAIPMAPSCELDNGSVVISVSGGVGEYRIEISGPNGFSASTPFAAGETSIEFTGLAPGDYSYTVFDINGCPSTVNVFPIVSSELPEFAISDDSILEICQGDVAVIIVEMIDEGVPPAVPVYELYFDEALTQPVNSTTAVTFTNNGAGRLEITGLEGRDDIYEFWVGITGDNTCDASPLKVEVTVHSLPEATFTGVDALCHDGLGGVLVSEGNDDYRYSVSGPETHTGLIQAELEALELLQGTYSVTITDVSSTLNCEVPGFEFVISSPEPIIPTHEVTDTNCELDNGEVVISAEGGVGEYRIEVSGPNGFSESTPFAAGETSIEFTGLAPGDYSYTVIDTNDCPSAEGDFSVAPSDGPEFGISDASVLEICQGDVAVIIVEMIDEGVPPAVPVYELYFDEALTQPVNSTTEVTFTNNGAGRLEITGLEGRDDIYEFWVGITGDNTCDALPLKVEVKVHHPIIFGVDFMAEICVETDRVDINIIDLTGGKDDNYTLTLEGTDFEGNIINVSQSGLIFEDIAAGTYTVTVNGDVGCETVSEPIVISLPDLPVTLLENVQRANCGEDNGVLIIESISGGFGPEFVWEFFADGMDPNTDNPLFTDTWNNIPVTLADLAEGEYFIRVFDRNACFTDFPVIIEMAPDPVFTIQDPIELCEGDSNGTFVISAENSEIDADNLAVTWYLVNLAGDRIALTNNMTIGNATYSLLGENTNNPALQVNGLQPGFYTYEMEVDCTSEILTTSIQIDPLPQATLDLQEVLCFDDDFVLLINNGRSEYRYDVISGPAGFTPLSDLTEEQLIEAAATFEEGDYSFQIYFENVRDCYIDGTISFVKPELLEIAVEIKEASCGQPDGSIEITVSGGTQRPNNTFLVQLFLDGTASSINPIISAGGTVYLFEGLLPNENYSWSVTDQNDCFVEGAGEVPNNEGIEITVSVDPLEVCANDEAVVIPNIDADGNPFTVTWFKDANRTQQVTTGTGADGLTYNVNPSTGEMTISGFDTDDELVLKYYMRVFGDNICTPPLQELVLTVVPEIEVTLDYNGDICEPDQETLITVNATGGRGDYQYSINGGNTWQADNTFTVIGEGTYDILVQSAFGCESEEQAIIALAEDPIDAEFVVTPTSCGDDIGSIEIKTITGGFGNYTWEWQDNAGIALANDKMVISGLANGDYVLMIKDQAGCEATTFEISVGTAPEPDFTQIDDIEICEEDIDDDGIKISSQNTVADASNLAVKWFKGPGLTTEIAEGNDPSLVGVSYTFDNSDSQNPGLLIKGLAPGIYEFTMLSECTLQEVPFTIEVSEAPEPTFDIQPIKCFGDSDGKIIPIDPSVDWEYFVDNSGPLTAEELEKMDFAEGTYTIRVVAPNGCDWTDDIEIEAPPAAISVTPVSTLNPSCGENIGRIVVNIQGGWPNYTVQLYSDAARTDLVEEKNNVAPGQVTFSGLGAGSFYFTVIDSKGCEFLWEDDTELEDGPTQIQVEDQNICEGSDIILTPEIFQTNAAPVYIWYFDAGLTDEISDGLEKDGATYNLDATGNLTIEGLATDIKLFVIVTGSGTCEGDVEEVTISVLPGLTFDLEKEEEQCPGEGGLIRVLNVQGGDGNYEYSIDGNTWQSSNEFTKLPAGDYEVFVRSAECLASEEIKLDPAVGVEAVLVTTTNASCEEDNGIINFEISGGFLKAGEDYVIELLDKDFNTLTVGNFADLGDGEYSYENLPEGEYAIRVTDSNGCFFILDPIQILTQSGEGNTVNESFEFCESPLFDFSVEETLMELVPNVSSIPVTSWTKDGVGIDSSSPLEVGVYEAIQIRDSDGCPVEDIAIITVTSTQPPAPELVEEKLVICTGEELSFADLQAKLEMGFETLEWFDENGESINPVGFVISGEGTFTALQTKAPSDPQGCPESRETKFDITLDDPVEIFDAVNYEYCQFDVVDFITIEKRLIADGLLISGFDVVWKDADGNIVVSESEANLNLTYSAIQEDESGSCLVRRIITVSFTIEQPSENQLPSRSYEICVNNKVTLADLIADEADLETGWVWFDAAGNPVGLNTLLVVGVTYKVVMGNPDAQSCDVVDVMDVTILEANCGDPSLIPLPILILENKVICEGDQLSFRPLIQNRRGRPLTVIYYLDEKATKLIETKVEWQIEYRVTGEVRIRGMVAQATPYIIYGVLVDENNKPIYGPVPMEILVEPIPVKPRIEVIGGRKIDS